jgi:hypothetical protein
MIEKFSQYNFRNYEFPKKGVFHRLKQPHEFVLPNGWAYEETEVLIIGETDDLYVERFQLGSYGMWVGNDVIKHTYRIPIGFHKSYFVRWTQGQLEMF